MKIRREVSINDLIYFLNNELAHGNEQNILQNVRSLSLKSDIWKRIANYSFPDLKDKRSIN